ncbi:PKD domain-containing protein [Pedobacter jamesrossensis]|uniref:PKD domain-containing protein n=1 Tax=Pedobacter jamesrossensis TaxID=1908238 RepID=A0ABV8NKP7_9SPHI
MSILKSTRTQFIALVLCGYAMLSGCSSIEVEEAVFPDQSLYMTATSSAERISYDGFLDGIYRVSQVSIPGQTYRYQADVAGNKLTIPLGVGRGGLSIKESVNVNIKVDNDTIPRLQAKRNIILDAVSLPEGKYSIPSSAVISGGATLGTFNLVVDLAFLAANPGKKYAIALKIESPDVKVNRNLSTTIILIDTKFLFPEAVFTSISDPLIERQINFTNTSKNGLKYIWDFGDGTTSNEASPKHLYASAGPYSISLTALGVTEDLNRTVLTTSFTLPTADFTFVIAGKQLNVTSTSTNGTTYLWTFGDNSTALTANASRTYATAGSYEVKLTVTDPSGKYKSAKTTSITIP